jgi:adenine C2-methylase RlmN of 23S rRNA A2503 and tRNA A37
MGFKSNLSSGEIVEQLVHASRYSQIRNVVFMVIFTQVVAIA